VRAGTNLVFATAELHNEQGIVCARCDGMVAVSGRTSGTGPVF
jgi:hypothetical protein